MSDMQNMSTKPEILFLAHRIPYPPNKGDKIRSWNLLRHLTKNYRVHLACFVDDEKDFAHTEFLSSVCETAAFVKLDPLAARLRSLRAFVNGDPQSFSYYEDGQMRAAVAAARQSPLVAEIAFSSTMASYIEGAKEGCRRIVDFCDADSEKWRQYAAQATGPMRFIFSREAEKLREAETRIANWADASFAVTGEEASLFNDRANAQRQVDWWMNGVDTDYFDPDGEFASIPQSPDVVFVGAMDYRANIDAVTFFASNVWSLVRKAVPQATFAIVGANPDRAVEALDGWDGVTVTGRVDDVRPWLAQSKIAVAPLRVARGVQNKVLEAMAMGKPVVATSDAATGIAHRAGIDILLADELATMADAVLRLMSDEVLRGRIGAAARVRILHEYRWEETLRRFDRAMADAAASAASQSSIPSSSAASSAS